MLTLLYFILILGIIVLIHELGHFIFAKKAGVHVYEFAIGMGPKLFGFTRKNDETLYSIRLIPLGGYVSLAGEGTEDDKKIPKKKKLDSKTNFQKFMVSVSGVLFNFIFAILILFIMGLFYGSPSNKPVVGAVDEAYPAYQIGIEPGDTILSIDDMKITNWSDISLAMDMNSDGEKMYVEVEKPNGDIVTYGVIPSQYVNEDDTLSYVLGISSEGVVDKGFFSAIKYAFEEFASLIRSMALVIKGLIVGDISVSKLSGPVGIYEVIGEQAKVGFANILYLVAFLSINVGFINFLPIPAFDGGRIFFIIIGAITRKPINAKVENIIHTIGFVLLLGLMLLVTYNDILRLF